PVKEFATNLFQGAILVKLKTLMVLLICLVSVPGIFAQSATGRLVGTVSGPDGVLPNANIVVTDNQTKQARNITSNGEGAFSLPQLNVGTYTVTITATGFKTFTANDLKIDVGKEYALNATLEVGGIQESVTVTAGSDIV